MIKYKYYINSYTFNEHIILLQLNGDNKNILNVKLRRSL